MTTIVRGVLYKNLYISDLLWRRLDFYFLTRKLPKAISSLLHSEININHEVIFWLFEFHFGVFPKFCIVSQFF